MTRAITRTTAVVLAAIIAVGTLGVSSVLRADQIADQRHRDLTRLLSEIVHRAHSHALLGEVVRPEFASPTISLSAPDLHDGWTPSCGLAVSAEPSDPARNLQGLVLVPRDRIAVNGSGFEAFAFYTGDAALTSSQMAPPYPAWLAEEVDGYASITGDMEDLFGGLTVTVEPTVCDGFSFYSISGERP
jgi:hypothetical protein